MKNHQIIKQIHSLASKINREVKLMELCGTHAQTIAQYGIKELMPKNVKLISGPGCPVCVTHQKDVDAMVVLAMAGLPIALYGDSLHLPGSEISPAEAKQKGADVNVVYSVAEALELQKKKKNLVFFGIGFETTAPMTAWAIKQGLVVYSAHKLFPPAMKALLANKKLPIDGFINPGHVSAIIGSKVYEQFKIPQVIAGFEAEDVLIAIRMLLEMIRDREIGRLRHQTSDIRHQLVKNEYMRVVKKQGNRVAQKMIFEVFEVCDAEWRGLGKIKDSGLKIKNKYKKCDVRRIYGKIISKQLSNLATQQPSGCMCGEILQGIKEPKDCKLFGESCKPENPVGACMVSVEGACNVEYWFKRS